MKSNVTSVLFIVTRRSVEHCFKLQIIDVFRTSWVAEQETQLHITYLLPLVMLSVTMRFVCRIRRKDYVLHSMQLQMASCHLKLDTATQSKVHEMFGEIYSQAVDFPDATALTLITPGAFMASLDDVA